MAQITTQKQYEWAVARVEELLPLVGEDTPKDNPNLIELELLSNLVSDYSDIHFSIGNPSLVEVLSLRLYEMNLTQKELAGMLGVSPSRVSDYLKKRSEPTLAIARLMCEKLHIDPSVVLGLAG